MEQCVYDSREFGKRLKAVRKNHGMTQEIMAEKLFLSVDSISNIENGKTNCMPDYILKICQMFNISADYLYFGIERELLPTKSNEITQINSILQSCTEFDLARIHGMIEIILQQPST